MNRTWRVLVFEIAPAALLAASVAFVWMAEKVGAGRKVEVKLVTDRPDLREIYEQALNGPAAIMKAADALDFATLTDQAQLVLHAAERLILAEARGENAGLPATVREAVAFEHRNAASRAALRERAFAALAEATIAPRAEGEAEPWTSVDGHRHRHFKGSTWWSGDSGAPGARFDLVNQSTQSIREFVLHMHLRQDMGGTAVLVCQTSHRPLRREPLEWRPKETLRLLCFPGLGIPQGGLQQAVEGLENQRLRAVPERVKFSAAPFWITAKSGAVIPDEWSRAKPAPPVVYADPPLPCETAGTCRDDRWLLDAYTTATKYGLLILFLIGVMTGLLTCALARRIFRSGSAFRAARRGLFIAGAILALLVVALALRRSDGFGIIVLIVMIPAAALAYVGWIAGFSIGVWALGPRSEPEGSAPA